MESETDKFSIRSKIWIVDSSGEIVFGAGRCKMLRAIERNGSIHAAAKELKMSYRSIWKRIKVTEERLGKPLLISNIGGASGGGSQLTPFARDLVKQYEHLKSNANQNADSAFEDRFKTLLPS